MKKNDAARRQEHIYLRNHVIIADFSMGVIEISGKDTKDFLDEMTVNNIGKMTPGKVMYTSILDEKAEMIDDVTFYCFGDERYWMITAFKDSTLAWFENHRGERAVRFEDLSDEIALWAIQGPDSRRLISSYVRDDMTNMKYYTFMENEASGIPIILSRTGFTGELGFEIFADKNRIDYIVADLMKYGKRYGVKQLNTDVTFESIPTEKGLVLYRDFHGANPFELGLDVTVKMDKPYFIGKDKLEELKKKGVSRKLMGFIADNDEIDIELESPIKVGDKTIGRVTTANYGYSVDKSIGYCMVDAKYSEIGQEITIVSNGVELTAKVCERVFYDKERVRVNANAFVPNVPTQDTKDYLKGFKTKEFKGIFAAMPTPMNADESLNLTVVKELVRHIIAGGVDGILVGGTSGEYPMMTLEERKKLCEAAVEAAEGKAKICTCVSTNTTKWTKELVAHAGEAGADFVLLMAPFDMPTTEEAIMEYYKDIASCSKPGVIIYHYPGYTSVTMSAENIAELARERNIIGIKNVDEITSTAAVLRATRNEQFGVLTGMEECFVPNLAIGGHGFMGVCAAVAPSLVREIFDNFERGDMKKVQELNRKFLKISDLLFSVPFPSGLKIALEVQGIAVGKPRKPHTVADLVYRRQMRDVLIETGVIK